MLILQSKTQGEKKLSSGGNLLNGFVKFRPVRKVDNTQTAHEKINIDHSDSNKGRENRPEPLIAEKLFKEKIYFLILAF